MKSLIVLSSVLFISIAAIFQSAGVTVTTNLPSNVKPGTAFDLTVTVSKGELSSFSKFQMDFPAGFTVEEVDVKGGTFSFIDQAIKIIWVSLPVDAQFDVKLKVTTTGEAKGAHELKGNFSYIFEGARNDANCAYKITVSDVIPTNIATAPVAPSQPVAVATAPPKFSMMRNISAQEVEAGKSVTVSLVVKKESISGFGKLTEVLPDGFTAEPGNVNGAIFSVVNQEVRFLWMTLPADRTFEVTYILKANEPIGEKTIKGTFSYVEDDKTRLNSTSATTIKVLPAGIASTTPASTSEPKAEPTTSTVEPSVEPTEPMQVATTTTPSASEPTSEPISEPTAATTTTTTATTSEPASTGTTTAAAPTSVATADSKPAATGTTSSPTTTSTTASTSTEPTTSNAEVSYRVQICATRKAASSDYFVKNNNVSEQIYMDMHEGWHKFTVGQFSVYTAARNHREEVKDQNKITGPFVTAYNQGTRITVQEALMITKQQWIP